MALPNYVSSDWASPLGMALILTLAIVVVYALNALLTGPYPKGVPLLREPAGATRFSLKTRFAYYTDCRSLFKEAYENVGILHPYTSQSDNAKHKTQYSKKGKAVLIPGLGVRAELILPVSSLRWATAQPDDVISVAEAFVEIDGAHYALGTEQPVLDDWQGKLVKTEMSKVLENLCAAMNDELGVAFDEHFGTDVESWRRIDLLPVVRRVVAQASSRFTVGLPMCRNAEYLDTNLRSLDALVMNAGVASGSPAVLQPILGRLSGLPVRLACRKLQKILTPLFRERIQALTSTDHAASGADEPSTHLQMMIRFAAKERPHELGDFSLLAKRVLIANFGSMHQTSLQVTNMLLNILGSDEEFHTIAALRSEITQVLGGGGDKNKEAEGEEAWTKAKVAQLVQADSVARETLRLHSFGGRAVMRKVVAPGGVVTDEGVALPRGAMFSFLSQPAHVDEGSYEDAEKYDPFRFSRARRDVVAGEGKGGVAGGAKTSFVTTSAEHLPFGHGRHACPGRFLIDFELKMIIAYVLRNYDIKFPEEYGGKRPENPWVTEALFTPAGAAIMVRRRAKSVEK